MKRENFGSRLGFLLVSAGCAIGIGNVWKFPYVTGQNGGGIFVLFYLLFLIIMGLPVVTMELAVGRASGRSTEQAYRMLEPKGTKWHWHSWMCTLGVLLLMMFYTTVSGWMLNYAVKFLTGTFDGMAPEAVGGVFEAMLASPAQMVGYMVVTVVIGILVCSLGVVQGIEKITKVMMLGLLVLIVVLAIHSLRLPGAGEGVRFYLLPSLERANQAGLGHVIAAAMNQSFFTLSIGIGSLEIFGSYMSKDHTLASEAVNICALDTFVALVSGLIIFPACYSFGVEPAQGPSLIFVTLPQVFLGMPFGRAWGTLFFIFMTFASLSTVITVFEKMIADGMEGFGWSRKKSSAIWLVILLVTSLPCALGYNVLSHVRLIGGRDILDTESFIVEALLLPIGALIFTLFCATRWGWGFKNYQKEANTGAGIRLPDWLGPYFRWGLPILILVILVQGLMN